MRLFQTVLHLSLFSTPVILLLVCFMPRRGRRYAPRLRCLIWALTALRLLIPAAIHLPTIFPLSSPVTGLLNQIDRGGTGAATVLLLEGGGVAGATLGQAYIRPLADPLFWAILWAVGMVLFVCGNMAAHCIAMRRLKRWSLPADDLFFHKTLDDWKNRLSIRRSIRVRKTAQTNTPLLAGCLRPCIYLPDKPFKATELSDILSHELHHWKRGDLWFKLLLLLANAVHWFNPAVYLMLRQAELDMEMACDSDVLRDAPPDARRQYGLTILACVHPARPSHLTTSFYGGKKQMKLRFAGMLDKTKKKSGVLFLSLCTLLLLLCGVWIQGPAFAAAPAPAGQGTPSTADGEVDLVWPAPGYSRVTTYGYNEQKNDYHTGIDISGEDIYDASVIASQGGTVVKAVNTYTPGMGYGKYVEIDHGNGLSTLYAQLSEILVQEGDVVEKAQVIAKAGSTGFAAAPHLHFEIRENGTPIDPIANLSVTNTTSAAVRD